MGKLWAIVRREYLERVRTKWFVISTVLAPIFFGVLMLLPAWMASRARGGSADLRGVIVVDATGTDLGQRVAFELAGGIFGDTTAGRLVRVDASQAARAERDALAAVREHRANGYLLLDGRTLSSDAARYVGRDAARQLDMTRLERLVRDAVFSYRLEQLGVPRTAVQQLGQHRFNLTATRLTDTGRTERGAVSMTFALMVSFFLYISIFIYGQNVMRGVIEEKQSRVAEVVLASVRPDTLLAGKVLGVGAVGLTQIVLSIASSVLLYQVRGPLLARFGSADLPLGIPNLSVPTTLLLFLYFVLGYLFYSALFAAVGAMVNTETEAQQVQMPVAMLLVLSALFIQPVLLTPDSPLAEALSVIPFSAPIIVPLRLAMGQIPTWSLVSSLVALIAGVYIAVWVAARIYRSGMLMYGKRPGLRELVRWIRVST
jgi:ABC-2 type transport system permease protein